MNAIKIVAMVLVVSGFLGLLYGGFNYTRQTREAKVGPIELSLQEKQAVKVPVWASVAAIVIGGGLLLVATRKS